MSLITSIIDKIKSMRDKTATSDDIDDNVTRDKYLRSLRREKRILDEEEEKIYLREHIAERRKQKMREHLYGLKTQSVKPYASNGILQDSYPTLRSKKKVVVEKGYYSKFKM